MKAACREPRKYILQLCGAEAGRAALEGKTASHGPFEREQFMLYVGNGRDNGAPPQARTVFCRQNRADL